MTDLNYFGPPYNERFKKGQTLDRQLDKSQLRFDSFQYSPHKDYLGHVFRWGFASRMVNRESIILDVGCGQDLPFLRSLGGANPNTVPRFYLGVDLNPIPDIPNRKWAFVYPECDFIQSKESFRYLFSPFTLIACLEVYEHVAPEIALDLLQAIRIQMNMHTKLVISTPVYCHSYKMARNHLNERTKAEMEDDLHRSGFKIVAQHGTFGNYNDFKKVLPSEELKNYEKCRRFYGDDVMGCYLAPRFPEASRNITHVCMLDESQEDECELRESVVP